MATMPGHGLPAHLVAALIKASKIQGKCADVSTLGWICTREAGHDGAHQATDPKGTVHDTWIEAPNA